MAEPNQVNDANSTNPTPETAVTATSPAQPPTTAVTAAAPPKPPAAPVKPVTPDGPTRRNFLVSSASGAFFTLFGSWAAVGWTTFTASMGAMTLGTVRFMFPNVLSEPPATFKAGEASGYEENKVDDKFKETGAWVIRAKDERGRDIIYALSTTCTHLGCTPNWLEGEKKFKCPCHGSGFKISGVNFEGPAPRPLERYAIRRNEDGQIIVDKSRKFQKEIGQWDDPDSYILL
jgi:cytochrome b6-f complex iron-sulfur subunit